MALRVGTVALPSRVDKDLNVLEALRNIQSVIARTAVDKDDLYLATIRKILDG